MLKYRLGKLALLTVTCFITVSCSTDAKAPLTSAKSTTGVLDWLTGSSQEQREAAAAMQAEPKEKRQAPSNDGYHDNRNNAVMVLQNPKVAMGKFPISSGGEINWVETLDKALIEPRADLLGESTMVILDLDIVMKNTSTMPWVMFPHLTHTKWLSCANCHPKIFIPKEHANPISMLQVLRGKYCGVCHGSVAFSPLADPIPSCLRCHSLPQPKAGFKTP